MPDAAPKDLAPIFVRLAVLWVAAGALFKLLAGTPADLPPAVRAFPLGMDLTFKLAIGVELAITFAALLRPRLAWPAVVALFAVFEVVLALVALDGGESCGCFGSSVTIPPTVMMIVDGLLLVAVLASRPWSSHAKPLAPLGVIALTTVASLALPFLYIGEQKLEAIKPSAGAGVAQEEGAAPADLDGIRYLELPITTWEGQMIYDVELAALLGDAVDRLPIDATCVLYRGTCAHCAAHMEELAQADDGTEPFILVRIPDDQANAENTVVRTLPVGPHVTLLTLPEGPQYLIETPADFKLQGAIISEPREGIPVDEH